MENTCMLLTEQDAMWSEMLLDILKQNKIPCISVPVRGAGLTISTGMQERFKLFVPESKSAVAKKLLQELFAESTE